MKKKEIKLLLTLAMQEIEKLKNEEENSLGSWAIENYFKEEAEKERDSLLDQVKDLEAELRKATMQISDLQKENKEMKDILNHTPSPLFPLPLFKTEKTPLEICKQRYKIGVKINLYNLMSVKPEIYTIDTDGIYKKEYNSNIYIKLLDKSEIRLYLDKGPAIKGIYTEITEEAIEVKPALTDEDFTPLERCVLRYTPGTVIKVESETYEIQPEDIIKQYEFGNIYLHINDGVSDILYRLYNPETCEYAEVIE